MWRCRWMKVFTCRPARLACTLTWLVRFTCGFACGCGPVADNNKRRGLPLESPWFSPVCNECCSVCLHQLLCRSHQPWVTSVLHLCGEVFFVCLVFFVCSRRCCVTAALRAHFPPQTWQRSELAWVLIQVYAWETPNWPITGLLGVIPTVPMTDLFALWCVFHSLLHFSLQSSDIWLFLLCFLLGF